MSATIWYPTNMEVLDQDVDPADKVPSDFRILIDMKHVKYITIDAGVYGYENLCFPPVLLEKLSPFPPGHWNCGRISQSEEQHPTSFFSEVTLENLPSIAPVWHPKTYDWMSLKIGQRLRANVYRATQPEITTPFVIKYARFPWEIGYYTAETQAYSWIEGHGIGPRFLGHLTEEGRVIGFLLEYIEGRRASIADLLECTAIVRKVHGLGILHGDLNRHNFVISEKGVVLVDFETAKRTESRGEMEKEIEGLEKQLLDESGVGGWIMLEDEIKGEEA